MKTDFKKLNLFEAALVTWSMVGVFLVAIVGFYSLTPEKQYQVKTAFDIFDIHEGTREATETLSFILEIPNEFYEEFYIAFEQVATLPAYTFEFPAEVASKLASNIEATVGHLTEQVLAGYESQNQFLAVSAPMREIAYDGKVMGAAIAISDKLSTFTILEQKARAQTLEIPYGYSAPNINQLKYLTTKVEKSK